MPRTATFQDLISTRKLLVSDGYRAKLNELGGADLIFLRAGAVSDDRIDVSSTERFREELTSKLNAKVSRSGDVIATTKGNSIGRVAFVPPSLPQVVYSPHLSFWRSLDSEFLDPGFLYAWSRGTDFQHQLRAMCFQTDMAPYLSLGDQRRLRIALPPIAEQRTIAHVLGTLDDKTELNRRMNQTLEEIARALFPSWFVDFDPVAPGPRGGSRRAWTRRRRRCFRSSL